MFDISTRLVSEQDEISGLEQLVGKIIHGNTCRWLVMKESSIFNAQTSTSFQILYCVLVRSSRIRNRTMHGKKDWDGSNHLRFTKNFDRIDGEPMEFEWIFSQDSIRCAQWRSRKFTVEIRRDTREFHRKDYIHVDVQRHFLWIKRKRKNARRMPNSFLWLQKDLEQDNGHSLVLVLKRSGTVSVKTVHKENGTIWRKGWCWNLQKVVVQSFALRAHSLSRGRLKSKGHGKLSIHCASDLETTETLFRIIVSANQLSLYGAVAEICE